MTQCREPFRADQRECAMAETPATQHPSGPVRNSDTTISHNMSIVARATGVTAPSPTAAHRVWHVPELQALILHFYVEDPHHLELRSNLCEPRVTSDGDFSLKLVSRQTAEAFQESLFTALRRPGTQLHIIIVDFDFTAAIGFNTSLSASRLNVLLTQRDKFYVYRELPPDVCQQKIQVVLEFSEAYVCRCRDQGVSKLDLEASLKVWEDHINSLHELSLEYKCGRFGVKDWALDVQNVLGLLGGIILAAATNDDEVPTAAPSRQHKAKETIRQTLHDRLLRRSAGSVEREFARGL